VTNGLKVGSNFRLRKSAPVFDPVCLQHNTDRRPTDRQCAPNHFRLRRSRALSLSSPLIVRSDAIEQVLARARVRVLQCIAVYTTDYRYSSVCYIEIASSIHSTVGFCCTVDTYAVAKAIHSN